VALSNVFDKSDREVEKVIQEGHEAHQNAIAEAERRDKEGEDMADGAMDLLDVYGR
jgi:checkpoint serine/threonine-protein kinase